MSKYIAVIPFLKCASHREVEADSRDSAIVKAMQEAYDGGSWPPNLPGPLDLHYRDSNECEDSAASLAWDLATRSWGELDVLARGLTGEQAGLVEEAWERRHRVASVAVFGPLAY